MTDTVKRALLSVLVAAVIYLLGPWIIRSPVYDVYVQAILFLAAIVGGGCCWIGSRK